MPHNGGYFLTRLKGNADPTIVGVNRIHRGRAIPLVGERLRDVVPRMQRQVLDVEVEVRFPRRATVDAFTATPSACAWWAC